MNPQDTAVLAYYDLESRDLPAVNACAGLKLSSLRASRERLIHAGLLTRTVNGRYVPVGKGLRSGMTCDACGRSPFNPNVRPGTQCTDLTCSGGRFA